MLATKVLKSPPQRAAKEGVARVRRVKRMARRRMGMLERFFLTKTV
jgi:hypothetical protein